VILESYFKNKTRCSFTGISSENKVISFSETNAESSLQNDVKLNKYYLFHNMRLTSTTTKTFANINI